MITAQSAQTRSSPASVSTEEDQSKGTSGEEDPSEDSDEDAGAPSKDR